VDYWCVIWYWRAFSLRIFQGRCQTHTLQQKGKELERVKSNCTNPEMVRIIPLDVTNFDEVPSVAQQAISAFGQLDYLINNAGISQRASVKDTHLSVDQRIMDVNFIGTVAVTKAVLPHFLSRQTGHLW
jgi:NADP-dependent 3-hydroxy acid dehydrogenase YdfG